MARYGADAETPARCVFEGRDGARRCGRRSDALLTDGLPARGGSRGVAPNSRVRVDRVASETSALGPILEKLISNDKFEKYLVAQMVRLHGWKDACSPGLPDQLGLLGLIAAPSEGSLGRLS